MNAPATPAATPAATAIVTAGPARSRVVLLNPPFLPDYSRGQRSPAVTRSGTLYYPMWLAYLCGYLERRGHPVLLLDAPAERLDEAATLERVRAFAPGLVVVETATPSADHDLALADRFRRALAVPVLVCGPHVSALPAEALAAAPAIDAVVVGEYELPVAGWLEAMQAGSAAVAECEGIQRRGCPPVQRRRWLEDLDSLPFVSDVYRRHLPIERYFNPNAHHPMVALVASRGCPFACSFCVYPQTLMGRRMRRRSLPNLLAEFVAIARDLPQVRGVFLEDDTFTFDITYVRDFCRGLAAARLPLSWTANARADLDRETLDLMKTAGVRGLCCGFESGNQALLDGIGKGLQVADYPRFAADAAAAGVKVHGCFMVGLPGETALSMRQTLQLALALPLDTAQFYPLMVYPGTRAYAEAKADGRLIAARWRDWLGPDGTHACVVRSGGFGPAALVRFCNLARRRFYLRRSWLWRQAGRLLRDPEERHRLLRAGRTFLRHLLGDRV